MRTVAVALILSLAGCGEQAAPSKPTPTPAPAPKPASTLSKPFLEASSKFLSESLGACNLLDTGPSIKDFTEKCGKAADAFSSIDARAKDEEAVRASMAEVLQGVRFIEAAHRNESPRLFHSDPRIRENAKWDHDENRKAAAKLREKIRATQDKLLAS